MFNWLTKLFQAKPASQSQPAHSEKIRPEVPERHEAARNSLNLKELGDERLEAEDWSAAAEFYRQAMAIDDKDAAIANNLGIALMQQGLLRDAAKYTGQAIILDPTSYDSFYLLGLISHRLGEPHEAIAHFSRATEINPNFAEALNYMGNLLSELGERDKAIDAYRRAIAIAPDMGEVHFNLATRIQEIGQHSEAIRHFRRALELSPTFGSARLSLLHQKQQICDWQGMNQDIELVRQYVREAHFDSDSRDSPFSFLALPGTTEAEQRLCAERWTKASYKEQARLKNELGFTFDREPNQKIKIGYLSADFHSHATAMLMAQVFELHDKSRFHVIAYSYGPDDKSAMRDRLKVAFDEFVDIKNEIMSDTALRIYNDRVDILVDLKGYTGDTRSGILALQPAPIQVNYLGYPGTMGADFVDYLIADRFVIPLESRQFYTEKIAYLPDCYQPNDKNRVRPPAPTRLSQNLPDGAIVFCCFNQSYKITEEVFETWTRLLKAVPGSTLWLLSNAAETEQNLRDEAEKRGVDSCRLVFAPRVAPEEHLARLQCADIFLDTMPYNAHTTCSEALWTGLPLVTCAGKTFSSRVAGSLLSALNVPELITYNLDDYFVLARELALNADKRTALQKKIISNSNTAPLFDGEKLTRNLESLYLGMIENEKELKEHFQIVVVSPANYVHSKAFAEIAETLDYGVRRLGFQSTITSNSYSRHGRNIILGSNLLTFDDIAWIPSNSILYNLEQIYVGSPWVTPALLEMFSRFEIWDYSERNVNVIRSLVPSAKVKYVPLGYVEEMTRIPTDADEDIDVLFYGSMNERRQKILDTLIARGVKVKTLFGVYGKERDAYIARAKLVLNMRLYDSDIFEIVRISYLLSNHKTVLSECDNTTDIEQDIRAGVALAPYAGLVDACMELLANEAERRSIAKRGFEIFSKRSQVKYLQDAMGGDFGPIT